MPFWRSPIPSVNPASPPPTMVMDLGAGMSSFPPLRDERMTEEARSALLQRPALTRRPKLRQLLSLEAGVDADRSVIPRHLVAADEPDQVGKEEATPCAARFERDERSRHARRLAQEVRQLGLGEMVQHQIDNHRVASGSGRLPEPIQRIRFHGRRAPT